MFSVDLRPFEKVLRLLLPGLQRHGVPRAHWSSSPDRWSNIESFHESWGERAELAAKFIAPESSVVDLGCGRMQLRDYLPVGASYMPADMKKWTDEVLEIDLEAGRFPPGTYDYAVLLGVLEYLHDLEPALRWAYENCSFLITSYSHPRKRHALPSRQGNGWVNGYSREELASLFHTSGWRISSSAGWKRQVVYHCERNP